MFLPLSNLVGVTNKLKGQDDFCRKTLPSVQVLVVAGGTGNAAANNAALDSTEILHQTDSGAWASAWTYGPRLPRALSLARAVPLDHKLLLTGGMDEQGTYHDSVNADSMEKILIDLNPGSGTEYSSAGGTFLDSGKPTPLLCHIKSFIANMPLRKGFPKMRGK